MMFSEDCRHKNPRAVTGVCEGERSGGGRTSLASHTPLKHEVGEGGSDFGALFSYLVEIFISLLTISTVIISDALKQVKS